MKAFRSMPYPSIVINSEQIYLSTKDVFFPLLSDCYRIQNADLQYLQSLQWCSVENTEMKFYKGFIRKKKKEEERNIKYLSIKMKNNIWNDFPKHVIVNIFSHHTAGLHAF